MSGDINRLLEDISIRHAKKHVDSYVKDLEQALGIKVDLGCCKYEYVYEARFDFCVDARDKQRRILDFGQQQTMFSVEKCIRNFGDLRAVFKFHPENAV